MNDMEAVPRHRQKPIAIRSDKAARLLSELTRDGTSQAKVIEDALEAASRHRTRSSPEEFVAKVKAIVTPAHGSVKKTYHEMRAEMYDEFGLPI